MSAVEHTVPAIEGREGEPAAMVITLRSGAQVRLTVTHYRIQVEQGTNRLRDLSWTLAPGAPSSVLFLDLTDVSAVHFEKLGGSPWT